MTTTATFSPQAIGQTEKALNAILDRQLSGTGLSEPQWITLALAAGTGGAVDRDQLTAQVVDGLKVSEMDAETLIDDLVTSGVLQAGGGENGQIDLTDAGRALRGQVLTSLAPIIERLWGDLPAEELTAAGRLLDTILARANAELA